MKPEWISIEDRLPEINQGVLAFLDIGGGAFTITLRLDDEKYRFVDGLYITHWMPLPLPPG